MENNRLWAFFWSRIGFPLVV